MVGRKKCARNISLGSVYLKKNLFHRFSIYIGNMWSFVMKSLWIWFWFCSKFYLSSRYIFGMIYFNDNVFNFVGIYEIWERKWKMENETLKLTYRLECARTLGYEIMKEHHLMMHIPSVNRYSLKVWLNLAQTHYLQNQENPNDTCISWKNQERVWRAW